MTESQFIPTKRKTKSSAKLKPVQAESSLPKDLEDKWGACVAIATAFNTMQDGTYKPAALKTVMASLNFLKTLHEQTVEDTLKHPEAHLIPELKTELDKAAKDVQEQQ